MFHFSVNLRHIMPIYQKFTVLNLLALVQKGTDQLLCMSDLSAGLLHSQFAMLHPHLSSPNVAQSGPGA